MPKLQSQTRPRRAVAARGKAATTKAALRKNVVRLTPAPKPVVKPGARLMAALFNKAIEKKDSNEVLADHLGISYPYLMALGRGENDVNKLPRNVLVNAADYLDLPVVQAFILAEVLTPSDFVHKDGLDAKIRDAFHQMQRHPDWCGHVPSKKTWEALPDGVKLFICMLFERATGHAVFEYAVIDEPD